MLNLYPKLILWTEFEKTEDFMFVLCIIKDDYYNYPKYLVLTKHIDYQKDTSFYYVLSKKLGFESFDKRAEFPEFIVTIDLYFSIYKSEEKFNLNKLGTDYLFNIIGAHLKNECVGGYPVNYVFVKEPIWPHSNEYIIDRNPLKKFKN